MPFRSSLQIGLTLVATIAATALAAHARGGSWLAFGLLLIAVLASSRLKVTLPRGDGSMSLNFPFILLGIVQLSPLQAMLLTGISVASQCHVDFREWITLMQMGFNIGNAMLATASAYLVYAGLRREEIGRAHV